MQTADLKKRSTRRRGNGEGSIYQRPDGRWSAQISMGFGTDGKRVRRTVYGNTKKDVQDELTKLQGQKANGTLTKPNKTTLLAFLTRWLDDVASVKVRERTLDNYRRAVNKHIAPKLGHFRVDKLATNQIEWMYAKLELEGVGRPTIKLCHAVLRLAFKKAKKWNLASVNICVDADVPTASQKKEIHPLTAEQANELLKTAKGNRHEALYVVAVETGMRMGELFGLQWDCVDLDNGAIHVRRTLHELNGKLSLGDPKTKASKRKIDLSKRSVDALHEHRKRQLAAGHLASGFVFTNTEGNPLRRSHFHRNDFKPLLTKAKLPAIRFHDLRHTAATLMLLGGFNPKVVQERLGHSKIAITLDIYSHVLPTMQQEAAAFFNRILAASA